MVKEMPDEKDELRRELEEIRAIKESLREELEELRRQREAVQADRSESRRRPPRREFPPHEPPHRRAPPRPPHRHRPPHPPEPPPTVIDLESLAESLEDMMTGLGEQIRVAMSSIKPIDIRVRGPPGRRVLSKSRLKRRKAVESIPPERIARVISPLGNVERLRILDYLKDGPKSFNDIESYIGKTGSSLTHHLTPLIDAGYIIKGAVRGTYHITVPGRLAYRLSQWLTSQVEREQTPLEETGKDHSIEEEPDVTDEVNNRGQEPDEPVEDTDDEFELSPDSEEEEDDW